MPFETIELPERFNRMSRPLTYSVRTENKKRPDRLTLIISAAVGAANDAGIVDGDELAIQAGTGKDAGKLRLAVVEAGGRIIRKTSKAAKRLDIRFALTERLDELLPAKKGELEVIQGGKGQLTFRPVEPAAPAAGE